MNISLIGYMGSGKSTIGKSLAKKINFEFVDLDQLIEQKIDSSISIYFKEKGEIAFRKLEHQTLQEAMLLQNTVLSVGGGTPVYYNNMDIINASSFSIYLQTSIAELSARLMKNKSSRPLISHLTEENLHEFVAKHLFERRPYYEQAQLIFNTQDLQPNDIIALLIRHLQYQKILP